MSTKGEPIVFGLALAYGGIAQLLAGMWEFRQRTPSAPSRSARTGPSGSLLGLRAVLRDQRPATDAGHAVGLYLIAWGIFTAYMLIAALRSNVAVAAVFALLAPEYGRVPPARTARTQPETEAVGLPEDAPRAGGG